MPPVTNSGPGGILTKGPGLAAAFGFGPGDSLNFQCWYRDQTGPCGVRFNASNGYTLVFTP
jgi:hypothetical protein